MLAHTKLKEDVGEFKYYKTARSSMTGTSTENYIFGLLSSPFYISGMEKSSRYTYDTSSDLAKEIDKQILLEMLGISSKLRQEYKVKGVFYYTTVLFYANTSVKTFCDIEVGDKNNYYLTCKETLDLINKKEEN